MSSTPQEFISDRSFRRLFNRAKSFVKHRSAPQLSRARSSSAEIDRNFVADIPQAGVIEEGLQSFDSRDWRKHFASQLEGPGLEIGPLHRPMVKHSKMNVEYVDRHTVAELRRDYPELKDLPLVEPHIIDDAEGLKTVAESKYDFVIAAHVIEHMRNPLFAVRNWVRVLKPGGLLYLIVPDKRATFDVQRVRTTLPHIVLDYLRPSLERDYEHFLDYAIHVQKADPETAIPEADRLVKTDYSIHFHVFMPSDITRLLEWFSRNVHPIEIVEGPSMAPGSDEFHFLVRKNSI